MPKQVKSEDPLPKIHIKGKKQFTATRISQTQAGQSKPTDRQNQNANSTQIAKASTTSLPSVPSIAGKKRKATEIDGPSDRRASLQAEPTRKTFSYLKKYTRRVPQDVVKRRWKALPTPAQRQVCELFSAAKRSVLNGAKDERRACEIETALGVVLRRLEKQLPRMPFPPKSKEGDFSLDRIVDRMVGFARTPLA
jgi:kinetochore protein Fta7